MSMEHRAWSVQGHRATGFSLVEVTLAMGIFAFVIVGILGLLPTALKIRAESSQETRAAIIAAEIFSAIAASPDLQRVYLRQGPGLTDPSEYETDGRPPDLTVDGNTYAFGYPAQTTIPNWRYRENVDDVWTNGTTEGEQNSINTLAHVSSEAVGPRLRKVTVKVRSPISLPLSASSPVEFSTLVYAP